MPTLLELSITNLRNIELANFNFSPGINILYGENGSGKTSILEGIHLLGLARSFRSNKLKPLITYDQQKAVVFGRLEGGLTLGVSKSSNGRQEVKLAGKSTNSAAELAHELPIQVFNSDTFTILEGSPKVRRNYLDWGVFHVEHLFLGYWRHTLKSLQQRNSLLKKQASAEEISPWTQELSRYGELIDQLRESYLKRLTPVFERMLDALIPLKDLQLSYERGWSKDNPLAKVLEESLTRDLYIGHTGFGPHRAELKFTINKLDASQVLSRGQQKLLVCALKLAQGSLLAQEKNQQCIYLIDDLPSELDRKNRQKVCRLLEELGSQVFISCVEAEDLVSCWENIQERRLFHVKHGKISVEEAE